VAEQELAAVLKRIRPWADRATEDVRRN